MDMRGTGRSGALACPSLNSPGAGAADDPAAVEAAVAGCARELGPTRRFFTTQQAIEDLELIRRQLGIERWAVGGVSYGTYVATRYARTYPQRVDRLLLDSLVPVDGVSPTGADSLAATGPDPRRPVPGRRLPGRSRATWPPTSRASRRA